MSSANLNSKSLSNTDSINSTVIKIQEEVAPYVRPVDWLSLPASLPSNVVFSGLHSVYPDSNFVAFTLTGSSYTVDWGDGIVENFNSGVVASHEYLFENVPANTLTSSGYRQAIVTVTANNPQTVTAFNLDVKHPKVNLNAYSSGFLDIYVSNSNLTSLRLSDILNTVVTFRTLQIAKIDCPMVSNMDFFFYNCTALKKVEVLNSSNLLTSTRSIFKFCSSLEVLDSFNSTGVTDMSNMFEGCNSLKKVQLLNTSSVTNMSDMFNGCTALETVPLFNTISVNSPLGMSRMFHVCVSLNKVPRFNTVNVVNMEQMFTGCTSLEKVPLFNTSSVTSMASMFSSCSSLKKVPLFNTANVTSMSSMFIGCSSLKTIPLFNTANVTNMSNMFNLCSSLEKVPSINTSKVTNMSGMFNGCTALEKVALFDTALVTNMSSMFLNCKYLTEVPLFNTISAIDVSNMFNGCSGLRKVPLLNTSNATNVSTMFLGCSSLREVPAFDFSKAATLASMFQNCSSLKSVGLLNTSAATNMSSMFTSCRSLETVPLFNTALVTNMSSMFSGCSTLKSVPLFVTNAVTNMSSMFLNCSVLETIPQFNTGNVTTATNMFTGCLALAELPPLNFLSVANTGAGNIFTNCPSLSKVNLLNFKGTISFASLKMSKMALESAMSSLGAANANQGVNVSANHGNVGTVSKSGTVASNLLVINITNTSGLVVGMQVTASRSPLNTAIDVTFNNAADTVTPDNELVPANGTPFSFTQVPAGFNLPIRTIFYVVQATGTTFKIALTPNGNPITINTDGTGKFIYLTTIASIVPNVSVTMTSKMQSSGTDTFAFRELLTANAILRGFAVTG